METFFKKQTIQRHLNLSLIFSLSPKKTARLEYNFMTLESVYLGYFYIPKIRNLYSWVFLGNRYKVLFQQNYLDQPATVFCGAVV